MKTATKIAETFVARFETLEASYDNIRNTIAEAIEADRAQRKLPYDTAELQGALDNNDPVQLLEIVNDIHTFQFYIEEGE